MELFKFISATSSKTVLTVKKDGTNLPLAGSPWLFQKTVEITNSAPPRIGASNSEILKAIEVDGFIIRPIEAGSTVNA